MTRVTFVQERFVGNFLHFNVFYSKLWDDHDYAEGSRPITTWYGEIHT